MKSDLGGAFRPVAGSERFGWSGLATPPDRGEMPPPTAIATPVHPTSKEPPREEQTPAVNQSPSVATAENARLVSDIAEIRAVSFRCGECQTVVSFPRIRWVSTPENCPNCGSLWMRKPSTDNLLPEDESSYVYRVVSGFREALQRLITVKQEAAFHLFLEFDEPPNQRNGSAARRNGRSHS
jgi:predicted RNA-binding Zn-ribbon protein involved in translation (DUF1610 family)